jgi:hypothetical protein
MDIQATLELHPPLLSMSNIEAMGNNNMDLVGELEGFQSGHQSTNMTSHTSKEVELTTYPPPCFQIKKGETIRNYSQGDPSDMGDKPKYI